MSTSDLDVIGFWSEVKLEIVRDYAKEYSKILSNDDRIRRHLYIDAFAGAGVHISKKTGEFVPGSPLNALNIRPPFSEYHFIDLDEKRIDGLQLIAEGNEDVKVHHGNCNGVLLKEVLPRARYEDYARALCLLDPYALDVNWQVLETAGRMRSVEVLYNFMIMDANMNVFWKNPDAVSQQQLDRMDAAWGDRSWRNIAYTKSKSLFGEDLEEKASNARIAEAFRTRLRDVARFKYVPEPVAMKNSQGATVYYLYFASPSPTGNRILTHIFNKYRAKASHG
jgi:three-Cys-motif partner protein